MKKKQPDGMMCYYSFRLTKREVADLEYKRKVLQLAKEYRKAGDAEHEERFHMIDQAPKVHTFNYYCPSITWNSDSMI